MSMCTSWKQKSLAVYGVLKNVYSFLLLSSILCYTCTFNKIKLELEMNFVNFNALIFLRSCTKSLIT